MRIILILLLAMTIWSPAPQVRAETDAQLLKVVVLSRHGVRSPTQSEKLLSAWSQREWPRWPVAKGHLTARGAELVTAMWSNVRQMFDRQGLLEEGRCPAIYVRADVDQRTQATAQAILDGMAPDCNLHYEMANVETDPLFHPVKAGLFRYDAIVVATDVLARTHGGLERLLDEFSGPMALMARINGSPAPALCSRFALMPKCQLTDLPNAISVSADGTGIRLVGSLGIASSLAEIFLLEYAQWPHEIAGWGEVNAKVLGQLLPIHARVFDVVNRANVVAWANGSALLREMTKAILNEHPDKAVNDAKLVVFVGHDTNIANVGGLLGINWHVSGFPPNGIPPAGAIFLELWRQNGALKIVPRFYNQSFEALHTPISGPLSGDALEIFAPRSVHMSGIREVIEYSPTELKVLVDKLTAGAPQPARERLREGEVKLDKAS